MYDATVNAKKCREQYSVNYIMLSERHDNHRIYFWLVQWLRDGTLISKIVVCDQSLALIT